MPSTSLCLQPPNLAQGRDLLNSVPEDAAAEIKYLETSAEPACDGCGGTFQTVPRRQVPTVRKRRTEGKCEGGPGGRAGSGSVRSTTLDTLAEQNPCQVGPTILFDRPRGRSPAGLHQSIPVPTMDTSNDDAQRTVPHESCISFWRAAARSWALSSQHPCWI
jgi:hypothetical protein